MAGEERGVERPLRAAEGTASPALHGGLQPRRLLVRVPAAGSRHVLHGSEGQRAILVDSGTTLQERHPRRLVSVGTCRAPWAQIREDRGTGESKLK